LRKFFGGYKNKTGKFKVFPLIRVNCIGSKCINFENLKGLDGCSAEGKIEIETKTGNCLSWRKNI